MLVPGYHNMDCMAGMREFPDKHFDLAIVDPPYGIENEISTGGGSHTRSAVKFHQMYSENHKAWDKKPKSEYFTELKRVSKNQIVCGGNYFANKMEPSRGWAIWDKVTDGVSCVNPELIYTSFHTTLKIFRRPQGLNNGFMNKERSNIHPTQKPIELYCWLFKNYASPGDLIIDTHVGSASSLIACEKMGFQYVGFELDADYYRDSTARLEKARELLRQGDMFAQGKTNGKVHHRQDELFSNESESSFTRIVLDGRNGAAKLETETVKL